MHDDFQLDNCDRMIHIRFHVRFGPRNRIIGKGDKARLHPVPGQVLSNCIVSSDSNALCLQRLPRYSCSHHVLTHNQNLKQKKSET